MYNHKTCSSSWAILPLLFCSAAVLAGDGGYHEPYGQINPASQDELTAQADETAAETADLLSATPLPATPDAASADYASTSAAPDTLSQVQQLGTESDGFVDDATETSSLNTGYVGGKARVGIGIDSKLKGKADLNYVIQETESSATLGEGYIGINPKADKDKNEETITGAGVKLNHHWVSSDGSGQPEHVNKVFGAYDQNEQKDKKVTVGYGQENQSLFWSGHLSKGLSDKRSVGRVNGNTLYEKAYDYGVGGRVGTFLSEQQMRVQGGLDYEWGKEQADNEKKPAQMTLTGGVEKFFPDSPHSVGAELEVYKKSGGYGADDKTETRGGVSYRYDIASEAGIWQPDQQYKRVRVEIPGEEIKQPPKVERKLVKHTMELEADTFFELDKAKLTPEAQQRLQAIVGQIRASGHEGNIRITGNTCDLGSDQHNLDLSQRRAQAVSAFLDQSGFSADELLAEGLGESQPKYPNTKTERHKNRRVDIEYVTYEKQYKDEVIEQGGTTRTDPKVVWRKELIPTPPLWVRQALHNTADHKQAVDTYRTTGGAAANTPIANPDSTTTTRATPVTIRVLANDSDPNGDTLTLANFAHTTVHGGTISQVGNTLVYTPSATFTGVDTFNYTIRDPAGNQATATVTVTVNAPANSNVPVANNDPATVNGNNPVLIDVLGNDTDPNGDTLSIVAYDQTSAHGGTIRLVGGQLEYTPPAGFTGTDTFDYTIVDPAGNRSTATVTVTVRGSGTPSAIDDAATTTTNVPVTINVLSNDTDPDGDTLTIESFTSPANGTVTRNGNSLVYTPDSGFVGDNQFTYTVTDGNGNRVTANVQVRVNPPAGVLDAVGDAYPITKNATSVPLGILANDEYPTNETVTITIVTQPAHGTVNVLTNHIEYTPDTDWVGPDELVYKITSSSGREDTATVSLEVGTCSSCTTLQAVNDSIDLVLNDTSTHTIAVLDNDTGTGLKIEAVSTPKFGTAVISGDGKTILYTLRHGYCEDHDFTYIVSDQNGNQATATVLVNIQ